MGRISYSKGFQMKSLLDKKGFFSNSWRTKSVLSFKLIITQLSPLTPSCNGKFQGSFVRRCLPYLRSTADRDKGVS